MTNRRESTDRKSQMRAPVPLPGLDRMVSDGCAAAGCVILTPLADGQRRPQFPEPPL